MFFGFQLDQGSPSFDYNTPVGQVLKEYGWRGIISKAGHRNSSGVYTQWPRVKSKDITDGTSNTIAIMEKAVWSQRYTASSEWSDGWYEIPGWSHNAHQTTMRSVSGDGKGASLGTPARGYGPTPVGDDAATVGSTPRSETDEQAFGSPHNGIMLAVFGDGSVHGINVDIDPDPGGALFRLGCRDDGETVDLGSIN